jgi:hypothetical protein
MILGILLPHPQHTTSPHPQTLSPNQKMLQKEYRRGTLNDEEEKK